MYSDYIEVTPPPEVDVPFSNGGRILIQAENPMSPSRTRHEVIRDGNGQGFRIKIINFVTRTSRGLPAPADLSFKIE